MCFVVIGRRGGYDSYGEKKNISCKQKHLPTSNFYGSTLPPTSFNLDMWVQREGYGRPESHEKNFQLFSIFIV